MTAIKNKYVLITLAILYVLVVSMFIAFSRVSAEPIPAGCPGSTQQDPRSAESCPYVAAAAQANQPNLGLPDARINDCNAGNGQLNKSNCGIIGMIVLATNILSGIAAVIIVIMITVGGIQYSMAKADPSAVSEARKRIFNAVIALVLFIFGYALLQYLIPGGLF